MIFDFHTHTFLSDGELLPMELIRRAIANGYTAMAISDHASASTICRMVEEVSLDAKLAFEEWGFRVVTAVELTHVPPSSVDRLAKQAKEAGAQIVLVHGETVVEPVPPGTDRAAVESEYVDILAHPGLITEEEVKIAAANGKYLEISCRKGHSLSNGRVAQYALKHGAKLLVNTDAHAPGDLLKEGFNKTVALSAGIPEEQLHSILVEHPQEILKKLGY